MTTAPNTSDDARFALMSAASAAERRNRPLVLVLAAALFLAAALIYLTFSVTAQAGASRALSRQQTLAQDTMLAAARLKAIREAVGSSDATVATQPITQIRSRIEEAGIRAGLKNRVPLPSTPRTTPSAGGSVQTKLDYEVKDESLGALLAWVRQAVTDVPGLEVYSVQVRPEAAQWTLKVTFSRWERAAS